MAGWLARWLPLWVTNMFEIHWSWLQNDAPAFETNHQYDKHLICYQYTNMYLHASFIQIWYLFTNARCPVAVVNNINPVEGVATICHQVRCMSWGHPSLFHAATSLLNWYKMAFIAKVLHRLFGWNLWACFLCMCNLGNTGIFIEELLRF